MSRLRLLMTADAVGGVWQYATALAGALADEGVATTLALLGPAPDAAVRALVPAGVALVETGLPLDWLADGPEAVRAAGEGIARLAGDFDLVQLNSPALAAARFAVPTVAVAHGCLATWWAAVEGGDPPPALAWQVELMRAGLLAADAVAAPTVAHAEAVRHRYALPQAPQVVHNGRAPLPPAAPAAGAAPVLTVGRLWDRAKGVALLDRVAARLAVPFAAIGRCAGPQGEAVAPRHLRLTGPLGEAALATQLATRPVFVSAARFEPFGLAVLEAAQAGCPLVLADLPGFRELWDGAARFVGADDEDGFVAAIAGLLADPAGAARLGQAAGARAARYTPAATAAAMAGLFHTLPARRAAA